MVNGLKGPLILIFIGIIAICVCGCIDQEVPLPPEEQAQVIEYANPITDNLLEGFNQNNYTQYSRDFSTEISQALGEMEFEQNRALILSRIGPYVSRGDPIVTENGDFLVVNYKADFEQEQGVDIRVVFRKGDDSHQIYGLWFNSPKLRN